MRSPVATGDLDEAAIARLPATSFGSSPDLETRLAALIVAGRKRATVWNGDHPNETAPGMRWRVTAAGRDVAVIETLSVERRRFDEIDRAFAFEEGEGDRSLLFWRIVHERYFKAEGYFAADMPLWCERFRLVEALDVELERQAATHVAAEQSEAVAIMQSAGQSGLSSMPEHPESNAPLTKRGG
jgi:uncharacterized protein YhfF